MNQNNFLNPVVIMSEYINVFGNGTEYRAKFRGNIVSVVTWKFPRAVHPDMLETLRLLKNRDKQILKVSL